MNFVILFGPPAVGKMTVGYELAKSTGMKLFHNHMTIELVLELFPHGHEKFHKLVAEFRRRIFEEVADSDLPGLIFTYVWALDQPGDKADIDFYCEIFRSRGAEIYFVELEADLEQRLERNKTELRLSKKPSKRSLNSEAHLLDAEQRYQMNTRDGFFYRDNYIKIDNSHLPPEETARQIIEAFRFSPAVSV
jgi:DNA polymerase III delta prime subunit